MTEWKVPAGSGIHGDAALALAATAAVAGALGRVLGPGRTRVRSRGRRRRGPGAPTTTACTRRSSAACVLTRAGGSALEAERVGVDPGRIDESLLVVDGGALEPGSGAPDQPGAARERGAPSRRGSSRRSAAAATRRSWSSSAREAGPGRPGPGQRRVVDLVRAAGGAARPLGAGRLVAVWAPPGARGPGRREAVKAALQAAGLKPLAVRVDLRGLELD